jgi:phage recombination protein Bet
MTNQSKTLALLSPNFTEEQIALIKKTICVGATDDELSLFLYVCHHTGLDPLVKQIHAVKRGKGEYAKMTIQTSIDGFRMIAERTGKYAPGRESTFLYDDNKKLISATSYIKKMTADGTWHDISANALYEEYVVCYNGKPNDFWQRMPHVMLAKCAEALALRKAFPAELSKIYVEEEMMQADNQKKKEKISDQQFVYLVDEIETLPNPEAALNYFKASCKVATLEDLTTDQFEQVIKIIQAKRKKMEMENGQLTVA